MHMVLRAILKGTYGWLEKQEEYLKIKQDKIKIEQPNQQYNRPPKELPSQNSFPLPLTVVSMFISLLISFL